jgi:hypothetical protein
VVAVSDVTGGCYRESGLEIAAIQEWVGCGGTLDSYDGADQISNAELFALDVDVLVPAAMDGVLTGQNADTVRARLIVEGANGPTSPEADTIFADKGITVVPDILANAGGVVVSYLEWVQNLQSFSWSSEDVDRKLIALMRTASHSVWALAYDKRIPLRLAAHGRQGRRGTPGPWPVPVDRECRDTLWWGGSSGTPRSARPRFALAFRRYPRQTSPHRTDPDATIPKTRHQHPSQRNCFSARFRAV